MRLNRRRISARVSGARRRRGVGLGSVGVSPVLFGFVPSGASGCPQVEGPLFNGLTHYGEQAESEHGHRDMSVPG